jgi:hypothetical protein
VAEGPGVSAVVACVDGAGRVLIVKQTAGPFAGAWLLPGGNVERNERLEDGGFHFLVHLFRAGAVDGTARPEPGSELRWVDPREIDPHPSLALALLDLGLFETDRAGLLRQLASIGVEMRRAF